MLITVVSAGGRYGSEAPMLVVPLIASPTPVPDDEIVGSTVMLENGGCAAHASNSGVKSDEPFSVSVTEPEGGFSRPFSVFSSDVNEGTLLFFATTFLVAAPDTGARDSESAIAPATAPVESAAARTLCREVPS